VIHAALVAIVAVVASSKLQQQQQLHQASCSSSSSSSSSSLLSYFKGIVTQIAVRAVAPAAARLATVAVALRSSCHSSIAARVVSPRVVQIAAYCVYTFHSDTL
jgi:hypothetical protein